MPNIRLERDFCYSAASQKLLKEALSTLLLSFADHRFLKAIRLFDNSKVFIASDARKMGLDTLKRIRV